MQYESLCNNEPQINLTITNDIVIHLVGSIMEKNVNTIFVALTLFITSSVLYRVVFYT